MDNQDRRPVPLEPPNPVTLAAVRHLFSNHGLSDDHIGICGGELTRLVDRVARMIDSTRANASAGLHQALQERDGWKRAAQERQDEMVKLYEKLGEARMSWDAAERRFQAKAAELEHATAKLRVVGAPTDHHRLVAQQIFATCDTASKLVIAIENNLAAEYATGRFDGLEEHKATRDAIAKERDDYAARCSAAESGRADVLGALTEKLAKATALADEHAAFRAFVEMRHKVDCTIVARLQNEAGEWRTLAAALARQFPMTNTAVAEMIKLATRRAEVAEKKQTEQEADATKLIAELRSGLKKAETVMLTAFRLLRGNDCHTHADNCCASWCSVCKAGKRWNAEVLIFLDEHDPRQATGPAATS